MTTPLTIRRAGLEHVALLAPLFDSYRGFYQQPSDPRAAVKFLTERLSRDECVVFLASGGETAVGFTLLYPLFSSVSIHRLWLLNDLFVAPSARRGGAGRALMQHAINFARETGAGRLTLRTENVNTQAQALYLSLGFTKDEKFWTYNLKL
jgi:GNAT superfamily N-acetyltransferase